MSTSMMLSELNDNIKVGRFSTVAVRKMESLHPEGDTHSGVEDMLERYRTHNRQLKQHSLESQTAMTRRLYTIKKKEEGDDASASPSRDYEITPRTHYLPRSVIEKSTTKLYTVATPPPRLPPIVADIQGYDSVEDPHLQSYWRLRRKKDRKKPRGANGSPKSSGPSSVTSQATPH
eukprot:TRINITY_DN23685_c0_g1_i1.p2 TRINITY_DN23685_c0_g1~~TRINITY_DN23685_c0_g1_i1.p2  ORF type:complete len:176 (+),score=70.60 TRINITY_DN23685_c0_g1_i1:104-631(+)